MIPTKKNETIVAQATPSGVGGVAMVRLSGELALNIAKIMTQTDIIPKQVKLLNLYDEHKEIIDKSIVLYFKAPHSFTGEDIVEFQCHGSPVVCDQIIHRCVTLGARLAEPGEFSLRAYLNGKMDLIQAEALADLIHATSETSAKMAMRSLQGDFSKYIHAIHDDIVKIRTFIEAMIDFPDEEIDVLTQKQIQEKLKEIHNRMLALFAKAKQGSIIREGITVVIIGPPNAGKSTLMNQLSGKEIAIVTDLPGTTRDLMREGILLEGVPLTLIDTAGLRETDCLIEQEGIKRAYDALQDADLILFVTEAMTQRTLDTNDHRLLTLLEKTPTLNVYNKIDKHQLLPVENEAGIYLSAKTSQGLDLLSRAILRTVGYRSEEGVFIARRRHLAALKKAEEALIRAMTADLKQSIELAAEDLRLSHEALSLMTGEFSADDLLGEIFSNFCIGK